MSPFESDDDLRRAFAELREEDRRRLPPFERLLARSHGAVAARRSAPMVALAAAVLVVVAASLIVASRPALQPPEARVAALVAWRSPTESLLRTPGSDLTGRLPRVGELGFPGIAPPARSPNDRRLGPLSP